MDRERERESHCRSQRYEDGEVKMYGAGESWRPFNRDRSPRRVRSPPPRDRDRERDLLPARPPRSPRPMRSPLADSDRYIPPRSPRRRSRSCDRYRHDRSREWRRRDRSRSPPRRFSPRRTTIGRRNSRSPGPKDIDRMDIRGRPPRRDWGRDRDWDKDRMSMRDRDERDSLPYNERDQPRDLIRDTPRVNDRDRDWDRPAPRGRDNRDRDDARFGSSTPTGPPSGPRRRSRSPPKISDRQPVRNRSPRPIMSPAFRGRSRSPFGRNTRITATYRPRSPVDARAPNGNGFRSNGRSQSPIRPRSSRSAGSRRSSRERPPRSPISTPTVPAVASATPTAPARERSPPPSAPKASLEPSAKTTNDIPAKSPPRGPSNFRASISGPPPRPSARPTSPYRNNSLPSRDIGPATPPVGPRGYIPPTRGGYGPRGPRGWGGAPGPRMMGPGGPGNGNMGMSNGIPTGPRSGSISGGHPMHGGRPQEPMNKPSIIQTQLNSLTPIIPGGKLDVARASVELYGVLPELEVSMKKLKEEEDKLREELKIKQEKLRKNMAVWDRMRRDITACAIRTDEAERSMENLANGEGSGIAF